VSGFTLRGMNGTGLLGAVVVKIRKLLILATLFIVGCQTTEQTAPSSALQTLDETTVAHVAKVGLSPEERLREAFRQLELGEAGQAEAELDAYLLERPEGKVATELKQQINLSPEEYYPSESFEVTLKSGESLSTLAQKYLGTAYQFYALAKYNDIDKPNELKAGQLIRIPRTDFAEQVLANPLAAGTAELDSETGAPVDGVVDTQIIDEEALDEGSFSGWPKVKVLMAVKNYRAAVAEIEQMPVSGLSSKRRALAIQAYSGAAEQVLKQDSVLAALYYSKVAQLMLEGGNKYEAFQQYTKSIELNNADEATLQALEALRGELADSYHKQASMAFRRQELDKAIGLWDKVLEIDPQHQHAMASRLQAMELRKKLSNLQ